MIGWSILVLLLQATGGTAVPSFEDYAVHEIFKGRPAKVDFRSHEYAAQFRTRLSQGVAKGPNFAGHFTVVIWPCGTYCQTLAVVDARIGRVYFPLSSAISMGACFRINSSLLITGPIEHEYVKRYYDGGIPEWWKTQYFKWDGTKMVEITSSKVVTKQSCGPVYDTSE
jgi:hypothetical protein